MSPKSVVVVSNRLPITIEKMEEEQWVNHSSSGGLVTAMGPVLRNRGGKWIGWLGVQEMPDDTSLNNLLSRSAEELGYALIPVNITGEEIEKYYHGFSNEILWPLFHDLLSNCNFDPQYANAYRKVNRKFAQAIAKGTHEKDYIWVHDYLLSLVARELRKIGAQRQTGFFLHTPFPPLDIFMKLPWRFEILEAALEYDLLGFQTERDTKNFLGCVRYLLKLKATGRKNIKTIVTKKGEVHIGTFPISIDFKEFAKSAAAEDVTQEVKIIRQNHENRHLILGVDRLDYTKGIPHRLRAFAEALACYPEMRGEIELIQIVVPSRVDVSSYQDLKQEIEALVGEINGRYTTGGWTPVHYMFRSVSRTELLAYYRACETALITPLKDGMNLVAKEYCACNIDENGVVILSEFAGAAAELHHGALLVNPYDIEKVSRSIHQAFSMELDERRKRMKKLRESICRNDIFHWVNSFLGASVKNPNNGPEVDFFVPSP
ncbi:MAG: trehalose-6-phosphate synthase [Deltaproteobacteria bacterium]|nr:trehalose-6-phosphate synthase [Deltaproteobacteria bacterium]